VANGSAPTAHASFRPSAATPFKSLPELPLGLGTNVHFGPHDWGLDGVAAVDQTIALENIRTKDVTTSGRTLLLFMSLPLGMVAGL